MQGCIGRVQIYAGATVMSDRPHTFSSGSTGARQPSQTRTSVAKRIEFLANSELKFLDISRERNRANAEEFSPWRIRNWDSYSLVFAKLFLYSDLRIVKDWCRSYTFARLLGFEGPPTDVGNE